ncbi:ATP-dependent DNA helicase RecQ, MusN [Chondrus crispus]|uniref:DNA 3'-5' helicase n=1 Tax=Chondrus crispus TaxID=2769 RepID=S0F3W2_CHOCR|nr:ATP-dependent DNA helicase RecQ, MusN [Chondrus crispus]CDF77528.1 ATP-dependent DNA helicase RecQ, MusN [Chondrus crispus]|eukprot:XP_005717312.1 ATP-dependent DNA helicase RecQ, MusN [Chondrus crispus]
MKSLLEKVHVRRVVIDEAHCGVADREWRSGYMRLAGWLGPFIKKKMVSVTFMSATLPGDFLSRASEELDVPREWWTVLMSRVSRPCLRLEVESNVRVTGAAKRIAELLQATPEAQCAIVFCRPPSQCDNVCESLRKLGSVAARAGNRLCNVYYSALPMETRRRKLRKWLSGEVRCLIGTTSIAMGIDHPSIGLVVHYGLPDSATSYAQHVGRAARRAGQTARCVLMCSPLADMSGWATLSSLHSPGQPASGAAAVDIGGRAEPDDASIGIAAWAEIEFVRQDMEDRRRFYRGLAAMALMARRAQLGACMRRLLGLAFVRYEDWDAEIVAAMGCFKWRGIGAQEGYEIVNAFFCNGSLEGAPQAVVKLIRVASQEEGLDAGALREDLHASLSSILLDPATKPASMLTRAQFEFMCLYVVAKSNCLSIIAVKSATRFCSILRLVAVPGSSGFSGSVVVGREVRRPKRP